MKENIHLHHGLKILSSEQIRQVDQFTIASEPIRSLDLMERAAQRFVGWFTARYAHDRPIAVFCGTGNNGGDGLAIARLLKTQGYQPQVYWIGDAKQGSPDFKANLQALYPHLAPEPLPSPECFPALGKHTLVMDAIFGSGLSRAVITGLHAALINHLNALPCPVKIAVDIASGLGAEQKFADGAIVEVSHTVSFQVPKRSFFLPENEAYTGALTLLDIGLNEAYIQSMPSPYYLTTPTLANSLLKKRNKYANKGHMGKVLMLAGSYGKMGAATLAASACMRVGAGLLTVHVPTCGVNILQTTLPEAMVSADAHERCITQVDAADAFDVVGMGPGLGTDERTAEAVQHLLTSAPHPLVMDADALNLLATHPQWLQSVPTHSILTPHPKEFERLVGSWQDDDERLEKQISFCKKHHVVLVLKGAHTSICNPLGQVVFNTTGNPGMATGGSGDVLLGMITGLLAQGYDSFGAALLGVFLHGLAADIYVAEHSQEPLMASDLIRTLPQAFRQLHLANDYK